MFIGKDTLNTPRRSEGRNVISCVSSQVEYRPREWLASSTIDILPPTGGETTGSLRVCSSVSPPRNKSWDLKGHQSLGARS